VNIDYISIEKELRERLHRVIDSSDLTAYHLGGVQAAEEADRLRDSTAINEVLADKRSAEQNQARHNEKLTELLDLVGKHEDPLVISYQLSLWLFTDQASDVVDGLAKLDEAGFSHQWFYDKPHSCFTLRININDVHVKVPGGCNITWYSHAQHQANLNKAASQ